MKSRPACLYFPRNKITVSIHKVGKFLKKLWCCVDDVLFNIGVSLSLQRWDNEFLTWNISDYGDVDRVHFEPREIWVPDIALFNK